MKLGIMQPYFFPYIGYFQLIKATDKWVVFDVVQYMRHHWMNRNRILHPKGNWQYINVPLLKQPRETLIKDIQIKNEDWKSRIIAQLEHYKKKAPYFRTTMAFLKEALYCTGADAGTLTQLNVALLEKTCERLDIRFEYEICSEMNLDLGNIDKPGEWALKISKIMKADEYINPYGGLDIFEPQQYKKNGIDFKILTPKGITYTQSGYEFVSGLSIVDIMMWNSDEDIQRILKEYEVSTII